MLLLEWRTTRLSPPQRLPRVRPNAENLRPPSLCQASLALERIAQIWSSSSPVSSTVGARCRPRSAPHMMKLESHAAFNNAFTFGQGSGARVLNGAQAPSDMGSNIAVLTEGLARMRVHQSATAG